MSWARAGLEAVAAFERIEARRRDLARREAGDLASELHHYLSTACFHGWCAPKSDECRLTCKYCEARCLCRCHVGGSDG